MHYSIPDLIILTDPYFELINLSTDYCEIKSNCTGHCWKIHYKSGFFILQHRHSTDKPYHYQSSWLAIQDCLLEIVNHDEFQLNHRHRIKSIKEGSFFEYVLNQYQT